MKIRYRPFLVAPDAISKCEQLSCCNVIDTWAASYCNITLHLWFLWTLSYNSYIAVEDGLA